MEQTKLHNGWRTHYIFKTYYNQSNGVNTNANLCFTEPNVRPRQSTTYVLWTHMKQSKQQHQSHRQHVRCKANTRSSWGEKNSSRNWRLGPQAQRQIQLDSVTNHMYTVNRKGKYHFQLHTYCARVILLLPLYMLKIYSKFISPCHNHFVLALLYENCQTGYHGNIITRLYQDTSTQVTVCQKPTYEPFKSVVNNSHVSEYIY